jgi:replication factor C subunit 3/5
MFLVDKYNELSYEITSKCNNIDKILDSFNIDDFNINNINTKLEKTENILNLIKKIDKRHKQYANFQHLIVYGSINSNKELLVNLLLEKIYGKNNIELKDVEYTINGYGNTKTKVNIKQSKYHIIIEPNSNGFDKYLIQEIIQNYAKTDLLNILKYKKSFKIVVINKLDNLSYYAQASLRRTMEKYSDSCKFIFICDQLSKIIEPIRSRCILLRTQLPSNEQIMEILLRISYKENIKLNIQDYYNIIINSEYKINQAIWLLELKKYNINYNKKWDLLIDDIIYILLDKKNYSTNRFYSCIKEIRIIFYNLFITNIPTQTIIRTIMTKLLSYIDDLSLKNNIIEIISIFELRLSLGTRHIIHTEALMIRLFYLFNKYYSGSTYSYNLDLLEF